MIPIIVTARMTSQRLPGKPLRLIAGKPIVQHVIENLTHVDGRPEIVLATSVEADDTPLAEWCARHGHACFRGPLDDLAARVIEAAKNRGAEAFVRVSGDSPLIDPILISRALQLYALVDLVTNVQLRTFPKGCSVEVIRIAALLEQLRRYARDQDREHVTTALYRHPEEIRIVNFTSGAPVGHIQLSVDTVEDFQIVERLLENADSRSHPLSWHEAVEIYSSLRANIY